MKTGENILPGVGDFPRPLENSWWVIPGKFLAGEYPGARDQGEALGKLAALAAAGVTTFIDLTETREGLVPYEPLLDRPPLGEVRRLSFPIPDGSAPASREAQNQVLDAIDAELDRGGVLYLHCRGGAGRTGLIAGCWLARRMSSGQDALDRVSELWKGCPKSAEIPLTPLNIVQQFYVLCEAVPPAAAPARLYLGDPPNEDLEDKLLEAQMAVARFWIEKEREFGPARPSNQERRCEMNENRKNTAAEVIDRLVDELEGTGGNISWQEGGFTVETGGIVQGVFAGGPAEGPDGPESRVVVETAFLTGFLGDAERDSAFARAYNQANIFGFYRPLGSDVLLLRSTVLAREHNRALLPPVVFNALAAQRLAVVSEAGPAARYLGCDAAFPEALRAGIRVTLSVADPRVAPCGQPWNRQALYATVGERIREEGFSAREWSFGLKANFPVRPSAEGRVGPGDLMNLIVSGEIFHPVWGAGVFFILEYPHRFSEEKVGENVFDLNRLEQEIPNRSHYLGFWCVNGAGVLAYCSFIPWFLCSDEILLDQLFSAVERASWFNQVDFA